MRSYGKVPEALASLDKAIAAYRSMAGRWSSRVAFWNSWDRRSGAQAYRQAGCGGPAYAKPLVQLAEMAAGEQNAKRKQRAGLGWRFGCFGRVSEAVY